MKNNPVNRARAALAKGERQAVTWLAAGRPDKARRALLRGMATATAWLDGSHPKLKA